MTSALLIGAAACAGMMLHCIAYLSSKHNRPALRIFAGVAAFGWLANAALLLGRLA